MRLTALALDYDGTIAVKGVLCPEMRAAIAETRAAGIKVILVTGRILGELRRLAGDLRFVDAVVAENGAVLAFPETGVSRLLAESPPAHFREALKSRGITFLAGECVVEASADSASALLRVIRELELPLVILFNRRRVMVLPQAVSKATGLHEALYTQRLSLHNALAIGDAENDHEMLKACEVGAAVAWGSGWLQAVADVVVEGSGPSDVAAYIRQVARSARLPPPRPGRRQLLLGSTPDGSPVHLGLRGRNFVIGGDPRSGKSWVAGLLMEQLIQARYSVCVLDPEGDYRSLEALPGVLILGGENPPPRPHELVAALRHPDVSVVVDLSRIPHAEKFDYIRAVLPSLASVRRRTGLPHRIVVDEAHYFLHGSDAAGLLDLDQAGYTLISYRLSRLDPSVLRASDFVIVTRESDPREIDQLHAFFDGFARGTGAAEWRAVLANLGPGEAALLQVTGEMAGELRRIRLAPRRTPHVRHRTKYLDVPVPEGKAFVFVGPDGTPARARTLEELATILTAAPAWLLEGYLGRSDFSRWISDVFGDRFLASQVAHVEECHRLGEMRDVSGALAALIGERDEIVRAGSGEAAVGPQNVPSGNAAAPSFSLTRRDP